MSSRGEQPASTVCSAQADGDARRVTVYLLTFPNGKSYVGVTSKLAARMREHARLREGVEITNAIREFGMPEPMVLARADSKEEGYLLEKEFIRRLNTQIPNGYNVSLGGRGITGIPRHIYLEAGRRYSERYRTDPEFRATMRRAFAVSGPKISAKNRAFYATEEGKALMRERGRSEWRANVTAANRQPKAQETLVKMAESTRDNWKDSAYRQKVNQAREAKQAELRKDPEWARKKAEKAAAAMRAKWQDPEYLAKMKARTDSPEKRAKLAENGRQGCRIRWSKKAPSGDASERS